MIVCDECLADIFAFVGVGLRVFYVVEVMVIWLVIVFLGVYIENYLGGGPAGAGLERLRHDYAVSLHGVGLSLGGADPLDRRHLMRVKNLIKQIQPTLISKHLA